MGRAEMTVTDEEGHLIAFRHFKSLGEAFRERVKWKRKFPNSVIKIDWAKH